MATPLLEKLGDLVYTGATGTNVSDLRVILIGHAEDEEL
jgi:glycerate-2-kinase